MRFYLMAACLALLAIALIACGSEEATGTPVRKATAVLDGTAAASIRDSRLTPPTARIGGQVSMATPGLAIDSNKRYFAVFKTEAGEFKAELYPKKAPVHVNNFVYLARSGYYNGVTFHRVIPGFMAQSGDPTASGAGGPGYVIPDEISDLKHDGPGILSMAKTSAPNTGGSQFFITFEPTPHLDGIHTVFGKVVEGMDVVKKIRERDPGAQPPAPPGTKITTIEITEQ